MKVKALLTVLLAGVMFVTGSSYPVFAGETKASSPVIYQTATKDQFSSQRYTGFKYAHNPLLNPKVLKDVIVDPDSIYGFSPNPFSDRLGEYASYDWSDPMVVYKARQDRIKYLQDDDGLYITYINLKAQGKNIEEIAREVSHRRNLIRLKSYDGNSEGLAKVKKSNLKTYGNEEGPTADQLYEKYGSWEKVLSKAFSVNPGMDACLGLYDDNYYRYVLAGDISGE
ncbi:MAG: hypothetical protein K5931_02770 [Lachnospiraceae bacterium]|nr:hypothetical protein [Lachnospiraceae bacterium]